MDTRNLRARELHALLQQERARGGGEREGESESEKRKQRVVKHEKFEHRFGERFAF